jgi:hypothetical protein
MLILHRRRGTSSTHGTCWPGPKIPPRGVLVDSEPEKCRGGRPGMGRLAPSVYGKCRLMVAYLGKLRNGPAGSILTKAARNQPPKVGHRESGGKSEETQLFGGYHYRSSSLAIQIRTYAPHWRSYPSTKTIRRYSAPERVTRSWTKSRDLPLAMALEGLTAADLSYNGTHR